MVAFFNFCSIHRIVFIKQYLFYYRLTSQSPHSSIPSVLALPTRTVTLDLPALQLDSGCEAEKGVHELIKDKFYDVVQKWFRPVPANPDYYFYCPETPLVSIVTRAQIAMNLDICIYTCIYS